MPTIKFLNAAGKYSDDRALYDVISYILLPYKTPSRIIGCSDGATQIIAEKMAAVSNSFNKYSKMRLRHFVVSFKSHEIISKSILASIAETISCTIGRTYQTVYALHEDTNHLHIHFVFNAVSYVTGDRYRGDKESHYGLIDCVKSILRSYGITNLYEVKYRPYIGNLNE